MLKLPFKGAKPKDVKRELEYFEARLEGVHQYMNTAQFNMLGEDLRATVEDEFAALKMLVATHRERLKLLKR